MKNLRKNWVFVIVALVSTLLGVLAILTAIKLRSEKPVAPTAPESKPRAVDGSPVPACRLTFTITLASPSPSPTPGPVCNQVCFTDTNCEDLSKEALSKYVCYYANPAMERGVCRLAACPTEEKCVCTSPSPTPSGTPSLTSSPSPTPTPSNTPQPSPSATPRATPSPTPPASCNNSCSSNANCSSGLICSGGVCRHPSCTTETDCICPVAQAQPSPSITPEVPVAGTNWPTIFLIIGGMALLVLGFALP